MRYAWYASLRQQFVRQQGAFRLAVLNSESMPMLNGSMTSQVTAHAVDDELGVQACMLQRSASSLHACHDSLDQ